jgi:hypothetical protein
MTPEHANRLQEVLKLEALTLRSRLILIRRYIRHLDAERLADGKRNQISNQKHVRKATKRHQSALADFGGWLARNDGILTDLYGFEGICDLLEVNPVHRLIVIRHAADIEHAITAIALTAGYEESASRQSGRHPADWKDGPLHQAMWRSMKQAYRARSMAMQ